jgi:hypothetical protein
MIKTYKIDVVLLAWDRSKEIRDWYSTDYDISRDDFTTANVREYGLDGLGEIADSIIGSAVENGSITAGEAEY